jgi:hypothetical protein
MSDANDHGWAFQRYVVIERQLIEVQNAHPEGYHADEAPLIEALEQLWHQLSQTDRDYINASI